MQRYSVVVVMSLPDNTTAKMKADIKTQLEYTATQLEKEYKEKIEDGQS